MVSGQNDRNNHTTAHSMPVIYLASMVSGQNDRNNVLLFSPDAVERQRLNGVRPK